MPRIVLDSFSIHLRTNLVANSPYVTMLPHSVLRFNESRYGLKVLPVEIPAGPWSVGIVTLRNRTPTPIVQVFVEHLREFVTSQPELRVREGKKAPTPPRRAAAGRRSSARPSAPT
jgi:DNA-binding transcriptional LysR family regulator